MNRNAEHLRLLEIFHYVVGGISALMACFPIIHLCIGLMMVFHPKSLGPPAAAPIPALFGWLFIVLSAGFILLGWLFAALLVYAGRCLSARKRHLFCLIMAGISCMFFPFGTALGVFTLIVLMRPDVAQMFGGRGSTIATEVRP